MKKQRKSILALAVMVAFVGLGLFLPGLIGAGDLDAPVEKTGQSTSYATGDDGELQKGVAWPVPRFTDNGDGTVTDNLTGLIWLKNAICFGSQNWATALSDCNGLADGACGLTDGSVAGDWRLPNIKELQSLIDFSQYDPALPSGHPFTGVQSNYYWSSTTFASNTTTAWFVYFFNGYVIEWDKTLNGSVWPVRDGVSSDVDDGGGCFIATVAR